MRLCPPRRSGHQTLLSWHTIPVDFQYRPFCIAKRPFWDGNEGYFARQNSPRCNAFNIKWLDGADATCLTRLPYDTPTSPHTAQKTCIIHGDCNRKRHELCRFSYVVSQNFTSTPRPNTRLARVKLFFTSIPLTFDTMS